MTRQEVYKVIDSERDYQDTKWGGKAHDNYHEVEAWILYMQAYLNKAINRISSEKGPIGGLEELRKVVALGVACFEVHGVPERYTGLKFGFASNPPDFSITYTDGSIPMTTATPNTLPNGSYNTQ